MTEFNRKRDVLTTEEIRNITNKVSEHDISQEILLMVSHRAYSKTSKQSGTATSVIPVLTVGDSSEDSDS